MFEANVKCSEKTVFLLELQDSEYRQMGQIFILQAIPVYSESPPSNAYTTQLFFLRNIFIMEYICYDLDTMSTAAIFLKSLLM